ncbi:UDP-N-acetylglucosamine--N-acetylmuramyl-(pentapeptide) pyrophosphoryl-undecaprenol N-acetylglucosamine transferase [Streptococcus ovuberis]|uniref:UDP-N-acetylglucosamine--N-acetylmuramyl-(pentapeptide) pyrophosphoryl-undecaprenol N-acetylglucosamine transferase n=1 Tax=Streptococcus ovuberis TaxID=1936207 RepID=A0A7X6MZR0_9STRE|nr:UDP-N-acetylglucosamine--N-acetylmuramyl-(pentapeptide) pyrophosphoryl-undecaprenol N-acetylglucosamine transferase [Streptococcus ovuberis]NKZ20351.1 UDP-N-acetylglucosamine--N-acetylmuramyl-(pentapeptide) pyrophosphoryl-undecaprenol N-acetylglucosamine transferase [Streptococcus ovuberis]
MKKIVLTGGGTVGHVTLNLLLIPKLIEDGWEVHYIGDKTGIEYRQIEALSLPVTFHGISTGKLRRYFSWQNLKDVFKVAWGTLQSFFLMLKIRPQALFSKGGFVSVPPVIAAKWSGVPVFIHESDLSMGLANKIAYRFATTMYTTFEQTTKADKTKHVGAVTKIQAETALQALPSALTAVAEQMDPALPTVLFVGGSAGAKIFNDFVTEHRDLLLASYNVINLTGNPDLNELSPGFYRVDYVTDLYQALLQLADVVITRGGANTIFELLALQKRHVIVPLGKKASRGDQLENAAYFESKGYAPSLSEDDLTFERLKEKIDLLLSQGEDYRARMAQSQDLQSLESFYALLMADIAKHTKREGKHV